MEREWRKGFTLELHAKLAGENQDQVDGAGFEPVGIYEQVLLRDPDEFDAFPREQPPHSPVGDRRTSSASFFEMRRTRGRFVRPRGMAFTPMTSNLPKPSRP